MLNSSRTRGIMAHIERLTPLDVAMPKITSGFFCSFVQQSQHQPRRPSKTDSISLQCRCRGSWGESDLSGRGGQEIRYDAEKINPPNLLDKGSIAVSYTMSSHGKSMDAIAPEVRPASVALTRDGATGFTEVIRLWTRSIAGPDL